MVAVAVGDKHTHDRLIRALAVGANAVVVLPQLFPLARKPNIPLPLKNVIPRFPRIASQGLRESSTQIPGAAAGDSAGGNITAALTCSKSAVGHRLRFKCCAVSGHRCKFRHGVVPSV
ncbi:MAG: alpha/beta hydrolase fold domain-containing protein [Anaerolineae bacterium]